MASKNKPTACYESGHKGAGHGGDTPNKKGDGANSTPTVCDHTQRDVWRKRCATLPFCDDLRVKRGTLVHEPNNPVDDAGAHCKNEAVLSTFVHPSWLTELRPVIAQTAC